MGAIQSSVNQILGSVQTAVTKSPEFESQKKLVGELKQKNWQQMGQIARMKKARERLLERQKVLKEQAKNVANRPINPQEKVRLGGQEISPDSALYKALMQGGANVKK